MKIELLENADFIRRSFIDHFLEDRESFRVIHNEFTEQLEDFDQWFDEAYMWDKLPVDVPVVTFAKALDLLKSCHGNVLFMSECKGFHATCHLSIQGETIEGFVAMTDSKQLADRISYEWYESAKFFLENRFEETLPEDLYIFDETYEWMIVFTHETDWNADDLADGLDTRFCRAYGFN